MTMQLASASWVIQQDTRTCTAPTSYGGGERHKHQTLTLFRLDTGTMVKLGTASAVRVGTGPDDVSEPAPQAMA